MKSLTWPAVVVCIFIMMVSYASDECAFRDMPTPEDHEPVELYEDFEPVDLLFDVVDAEAPKGCADPERIRVLTIYKDHAVATVYCGNKSQIIYFDQLIIGGDE